MRTSRQASKNSGQEAGGSRQTGRLADLLNRSPIMKHTSVKTTSTLMAGLFLTTLMLSANTPTAALIVDPKDPCRTRSLDKLVVTRVRPRYPPERGFHASGDVIVKVTVNELGNVESARAICGHPLLFALAIQAVMKWKFRPFVRKGRAQKMRGVSDGSFSA